MYGIDLYLEYVATFTALPEERRRQRLLVGHTVPGGGSSSEAEAWSCKSCYCAVDIKPFNLTFVS